MMRAAALLALTPMLCAAQSSARASLEGQVVRGGTGEPVGKASVLLRPAEGGDQASTTTSGEGGRFSFKDLAPGRYRLIVSRNGYRTTEYGQRGNSRSGTVIVLGAGQEMKDIRVTLSPGAVVAGRVVNEDSEAVPHVRVQALRMAYLDGRPQLVPAGSATTNDLGEYRVFGLPPGRYYVTANASAQPGGFIQTGEGEQSYLTVFFGGVTDFHGAAPLPVAEGSENRGIDFRLLPARTFSVKGRINAKADSPQRGIMIALAPRDAGPLALLSNFRAGVRPNGEFELRRIPPGNYVLVANHYDRQRSLNARLPVAVGNADVEGLEVTLAPGAEIAGRVRVDGDAKTDLSSYRVVLQSREASPFSSGAAANVNADGTFVVNNVPAGDYSAGLTGRSEGMYLRSIRYGDQEVLDGALSVQTGASTATLDMVLRPTAGQVEGVIMDDRQQPAQGAMVVLVPESSRRAHARYYRTATADQTGRFTFRAVIPGDYSVFAWEDIENGAWRDPDVLAPVESQGARVTVREQGSESVSVRVITAGPPR